VHNIGETANTEQPGTEMRLNSGLLFWGVALLTAGAVALAVQAELLPSDAVANAWRMWPLILVAIGVGLLLSRSPLAPLGAVVGGVVLGIIGGALLTVGPSVGACSGEPQDDHTLDGTLDAETAEVEVDFDCGDLEVVTQAGSAWALVARGDTPRVDGEADRLELGTRDDGPFGIGGSRNEWTLTLPWRPVLDMDLSLDAGSAELTLTDTIATGLSLDVNAGDATLDLSGARVNELDVGVNAGSGTIVVDRGSTVSGTLETNAGSLNLCADERTGLAITVEDSVAFSHNLQNSGLTRSSNTWRSETGTQVSLRVEGNAGSFTLNPEEGC
jgi:hypothetical protein